MNIEANGDEKIIVTLSLSDMSDLDITYDEMDYSNIETRRVIWTILDRARKALGKPVDTDGRLLIEAQPLDDGGCVLHFTSSPLADYKSKKRLVMKKDGEPLIFSTRDINDFLEALNRVHLSEEQLKTYELYKLCDSFFILLKPLPSFSHRLLLMLSEYGTAAVGTPTELSKIYEYGMALS